MDVILHVGAHRTAATTFQAYMRANSEGLARHGVGFWGPGRTRSGLFRGIIPQPDGGPERRQAQRAAGRIALAREAAGRSGVRQLVISDEGMLGSVRRNLAAGTLYPDAGARLARHVSAFGSVDRIAISIRSPALYWASCLAEAVVRGHPLPTAAEIAEIAALRRGWRAVISDIAVAAGAGEVIVMAHEELGGLPERRLWHMLGQTLLPPMTHARDWLNHGPDLAALRTALMTQGADPAALPPGTGRWMPFDAAQQAAMHEDYADDLFWLAAGADGLARLAGEKAKLAGEAGTHPHPAEELRGRHDDIEEGRMVGNR
ncbi:hypothetical protein [Pseudooceanicola sp. LIPI14-2-Ac024]|uniref:hypothetical protein n=1 Tax=Pseudooceanicola sp. LIPI14-2-Ac024 TaxID=3344875 RepID=UPI0035CE89A8